MDTQCAETPLVDLLRGIPKDHRITVPMMCDEDGREIGHSMIPVGHLMHRAADDLAAAQARVEWLEGTLLASNAASAELLKQLKSAESRLATAEADALRRAAEICDRADLFANSEGMREGAREIKAAILALILKEAK